MPYIVFSRDGMDDAWHSSEDAAASRARELARQNLGKGYYHALIIGEHRAEDPVRSTQLPSGRQASMPMAMTNRPDHPEDRQKVAP